jgi:hypothetical protein
MFMTDIKAIDPYTNKQTLYKYESEDRQLLVNLLHEYSEKLIQISQELDLKKQQRSKQTQIYKSIEKIFGIAFYISAIGLASVSLLILSLYLVFRYQMFVSNQSKAFSSDDLMVVAFLLGLFILSGFVVFQSPKINASTNRTPTKIVRMIGLLEEDTRTIADKLEKVMRVTIEIQDQIEINLARKLELDLRIGDAQSALEYYYSVVKTR